MFEGELNFWLSLIFGLLFVYLLARLILQPAKIFFKVFLRIVLGAVVLFLVNTAFGIFFDFQIAINVITALTVGFLGLPGMILLVATMLLVGGV
ncbi:pro-sigmaK processing inhibitor BofA family protein [Natranaerobius thermophilus]|uniref:Pro-sigmaK processing inhibitor BofA n=1 Tax=Natranaerobius thermophilus (strain ATCC BAA-1301 / DSM 18059 / JW/NM-WN-LF) TaxID=457570 RepID=B2A304_NATTJ|nr:pro-sigmaK processing inhibitor BofA family protein [Natranaerobius thermophilus]ACB83618.1 pro-sigmaK processing inhibitor BofA [Natranaerobius thermophilus JW/NM-WN-LF]